MNDICNDNCNICIEISISLGITESLNGTFLQRLLRGECGGGLSW